MQRLTTHTPFPLVRTLLWGAIELFALWRSRRAARRVSNRAAGA